jgi:hypothetical protein
MRRLFVGVILAIVAVAATGTVLALLVSPVGSGGGTSCGVPLDGPPITPSAEQLAGWPTFEAQLAQDAAGWEQEVEGPQGGVAGVPQGYQSRPWLDVAEPREFGGQSVGGRAAAPEASCDAAGRFLPRGFSSHEQYAWWQWGQNPARHGGWTVLAATARDGEPTLTVQGVALTAPNGSRNGYAYPECPGNIAADVPEGVLMCEVAAGCMYTPGGPPGVGTLTCPVVEVAR